MSATRTESNTLMEELEQIVRTGAANDDTLATEDKHSDHLAWQKVIDYQLVEWGRNPDLLEEDDLIAPTLKAIDRAIKIAVQMRDQRFSPPKRVVPDGDGGVVLEQWYGSVTESIEIESDGSAEYVVCDGGRVVQRNAYLVGQ